MCCPAEIRNGQSEWRPERLDGVGGPARAGNKCARPDGLVAAARPGVHAPSGPARPARLPTIALEAPVGGAPCPPLHRKRRLRKRSSATQTNAADRPGTAQANRSVRRAAVASGPGPPPSPLTPFHRLSPVQTMRRGPQEAVSTSMPCRIGTHEWRGNQPASRRRSRTFPPPFRLHLTSH